MRSKVIFILFKLCLLIVMCTAAPGADTDLSSGDRDDVRNVKLDAPVGDTDLSSGAEIEGRIHKLQVPAGDSDLSSGADDGKIVKLQGSNKSDEKDDGPVADEGIDGENHADNAIQHDSLDENEEPINADENETSIKDEPKDGESSYEGHDDKKDTTANEKDTSATDEPIEGEEKNYEVSENGLNGNEETINGDDNKITEQEKKEKSPLEKYNEYKYRQYCKPGVPPCAYDPVMTLETPGFLFNSAEKANFKIWPEAKIPYYIDELSYDKFLRDEIRFYLNEARVITGLMFEKLKEPPEGDKRWVFFVNRRGQLDCKDYNTNSFTNTGVQKVIVGYDCLKHGGHMAAIVMALAGVPPQHNAPDRDRYIKVVTDKILPEKQGLFKVLKNSDWIFQDLEYDFDSVTHYRSHKYTVDGSETIERLLRKDNFDKNEYNMELAAWMNQNEKETFSPTDVLKVRWLYNYILSEDVHPPNDCLYFSQSGPDYVPSKPLKNQKKVLSRPKPKEYLEAVKKERKLLAGQPYTGEQLSSLE